MENSDMKEDMNYNTLATLSKLELVKEIRSKTLELLKVKSNLIDAIEVVKKEEKAVAEYRAELNSLFQEKMARVEELRQIHSDINSMEGVIKQSEGTFQKASDLTQQLMSQYGPLKVQVDHLRINCLGLEKMPELAEEDPELFGSLLEPKTPFKLSNNEGREENLSREDFNHMFQQNQQNQPIPTSTNFTQHTQGFTSSIIPNFSRQQPPPMKICQSCQQQIHRNAPICPLCKAKSRARHPKKSKKSKSPRHE